LKEISQETLNKIADETNHAYTFLGLLPFSKGEERAAREVFKDFGSREW
jgi:hypothetical protein